MGKQIDPNNSSARQKSFNPLAGKSFGKVEDGRKPALKKVSIPLRGSCLGKTRDGRKGWWTTSVFQSPCGEVVWESEDLSMKTNGQPKVSIPLRGSRLGKTRSTFTPPSEQECFNPLAGKSFGKGTIASDVLIGEGVSIPLRGSRLGKCEHSQN